MAPVLMYGTAACPYCQAARALFSDLGVSFEEIRVDLEPSRRQQGALEALLHTPAKGETP
ncbi:MAG: hypothetical protein EBU29_08240 [Gammaproteobacteria bacterium]|nr:hypothetical protein [Gammaproteobacteria bacterium]